MFADSSEAGYGAVIYLHIPEDEQLRTILVSKDTWWANNMLLWLVPFCL